MNSQNIIRSSASSELTPAPASATIRWKWPS